MKRHCTIFCLIMVLSTLRATAHASSVCLVKGGVRSELQAPAISSNNAIILTFGEERVIVSDPPLSLPDSRLLAQEVSLSELFLLLVGILVKVLLEPMTMPAAWPA